MTLQDEALAGSFPQASEDQWRKSRRTRPERRGFRKARRQDLRRRDDQSALSARRSPRPARSAQQARTLGDSRARRLADAKPPTPRRSKISKAARTVCISFSPARKAPMARRLRDDGDAAYRACLRQGAARITAFPVMIEDSPRAPNAAEAIMRLVDKNHIDPSITRVSFGFDPLGAQLRHGFSPAPWSEGAKSFAEQAKRAAQGRLHLWDRRRRRPRRPCRRRNRGAGTRLTRSPPASPTCARSTTRASTSTPRAKCCCFGSPWTPTNSLASPNSARCAALWATDRGILRPCARAGADPRRNRLAHDDRQRSLEQSAARHHRGVFGGGRRRRRHHRAALHPGARRARRLRPPTRARHAARAARRSLISTSSTIRPAAPAASKR